MAIKKPKVAVFKFASCDGCQLSILDAEDELLIIANAVDIAFFPEASRRMLKGPYDISFVEGSITTPHDVEYIREVRKMSRVLVTIGACATAGGIQALRNWKDIKEFTQIVYAKPEYISALDRSLPISSYVHVDFELQGCPINKYQFIEVMSAFLHRRRPNVSSHSVCIECKTKGNICVLVDKGIPCLGPVTHAGCGALCPSYQRGCYGCYGPMESPNTQSLSKHFIRLGLTGQDVMLAFRGFNAYAEAFRKESDAHEK
ncbi:MAG: oxidoreductase [Nitrospinae bacterium]|nr:oxidoreductase [Nitrospinota bacterium]